MKKLITFLSALIIVLLFSKTQAQSDPSGIGGHQGVSPYYCGWDNTTTIPLNIMHKGQHSIKFFTNNLHRMIIDSTTGRVGIGLNFMSPQSQFHLNQWDTGHVFTQWTNSNTGSGAAHGLLVGILGDGTAELNQQEGAAMNFLTSGSPRMTIDANGYVGIGTKTPKVKLEVADGDIAVTTIGKGLILKTTDGDNYYRITIDNTGKLNTELITKL